jgi:hypothetical protein
VITDSDGNFDFGPIPKGLYHLRIDADQMDNWFDVEVIDTVSKTDRIIVDVSPVAPDGKGGHKFIEKRL